MPICALAHMLMLIYWDMLTIHIKSVDNCISFSIFLIQNGIFMGYVLCNNNSYIQIR